MPTYAELQKKIADLQVQAEDVRKQELATVISEIKSKMAQYGITAEDLASRKRGPKKASTPVAPKYKDPASGATWSGRGISPKWLKEAMAKGKKKESFLIK